MKTDDNSRRKLKPMDADALGKWFASRGQRYVVLELAFVKKIPPAHREGLLEIACRCFGAGFGDEERHSMEMYGPDRCMEYFTHANPGYLLLPTDRLCGGEFSTPELAVLQEIIELYKSERMIAGVTSREEPCECGGEAGCKICGGGGVVVVLDETVVGEEALAR